MSVRRSAFTVRGFGCVDLLQFRGSFERGGNREFAQFISIAKGSFGETRGQLLYALDLGYLDGERFEQLNELGRNSGSVPSRI